MGITNLFTRSAIKCKDKELKERINNWTKNEGRVFEDFATFLELVGIKTPVQLGNFDTKSKSFKCISKNGKEYRILLFFRDRLSCSPEIHVTEGIETKIYICHSKSDSQPEPKVAYYARNIEEDGKSLHNIYGNCFCNRTLKLDECHKLIIEFDENKYSKNSSTRVLVNSHQIEEYLFSLDINLVVSEVYDNVISLLGFDKNDIKDTEKILISYEKEVDKTKQVLACVRLANGIMIEYAILEDNQTFHIYSDKNWCYSSADTRILYDAYDDTYIFPVTAKEDDINRVKERISKLWKFID